MKQKAKAPHVYVPPTCKCVKCRPGASTIKRPCLMCRRRIQFDAQHWGVRWNDVPFGVKCACKKRCTAHNHQPRCKPCDKLYRRRRGALYQVQQVLAHYGLPKSRLTFESYISAIEFNATRLSAAEKQAVSQALIARFNRRRFPGKERPAITMKVGNGTETL